MKDALARFRAAKEAMGIEPAPREKPNDPSQLRPLRSDDELVDPVLREEILGLNVGEDDDEAKWWSLDYQPVAVGKRCHGASKWTFARCHENGLDNPEL